MIKLCVFDCDGTLVDSQHTIVACMHAAFEVHQIPRPEAQAVRRVIGLPLLDAMAALLPEAPPETHAGLKESYVAAFHARRQTGDVEEPLFPGVLEALQALEAAGWLLGVATGKAHRGLVSTLRPHGLEDRFVTLQTSDRTPGKPHPDMLLRAMAETGAHTANTIMIGDTTFDMLMARNAGTMAIAVAWGYHDLEELDAAGADAVVHAFDALPGAVERLMGGA